MADRDATPVPENREAEQRFVVTIDGHEAELVYDRTPERLILIHTEVPDALEGHGVGSALVRTAIDLAARENLVVVPRCPFARRWLRQHPRSRGAGRDRMATAGGEDGPMTDILEPVARRRTPERVLPRWQTPRMTHDSDATQRALEHDIEVLEEKAVSGVKAAAIRILPIAADRPVPARPRLDRRTPGPRARRGQVHRLAARAGAVPPFGDRVSWLRAVDELHRLGRTERRAVSTVRVTGGSPLEPSMTDRDHSDRADVRQVSRLRAARIGQLKETETPMTARDQERSTMRKRFGRAAAVLAVAGGLLVGLDRPRASHGSESRAAPRR